MPHNPDEKRISRQTCPACGKTLKAKTGRGRAFTAGIFLIFLNIMFLAWFRNSRVTETSAGSPDTRYGTSGRYGGLLSYINGPGADPACGTCVEAAEKDAGNKALEAERKKFEGMALVPAGAYIIGSPDGEGDPDEHPRHEVFLDAFYIDKYEVTNAAYMKFTAATGANQPEWMKPGSRFNIESGKDPYYGKLGEALKAGDNPVVGVAWKDAEAYCRWAGKRLPTEAEWEAAARGGTGTKYFFGNSETAAGEYSWNGTNSENKTRPVGGKKPNPFGLYDTQGNVWEWTSDFYGRDYYAKSPKRGPKGPEKGDEHVIRGGSWAFDADSGRTANRASYGKANDDVGFRCAASKRGAAGG